MLGFINGLIALFQSVLLLSLGASVVLGLILLSKSLFGRRMSARSHARIWLILILFLILPIPQLLGSITIPKGTVMDFWTPMNQTIQMLHVEPILDPASASVSQSGSTSAESESLNNASDPTSSISTGSAAAGTSTGVSISNRSSASMSQEISQPTNNNLPISGILSIKLTAAQIFWLIAGSIWLAGLLLLLGIFIFGYSRTLLTLRKKGLSAPASWSSRFERLAQGMHCRQPVKLYLLDEASGPFIIGVLHRKIVLKSDMLEQLEPDEIDAVLTHELVHFRHHDPLLRLLLCCLQSVQWFNPLCWIAIRLIQRDCEYYCDDMTVRFLGERGNRTQYARTLLATVTCCAGHQVDGRAEIPGSILMASFIEINLKDRIHRVLHERKTSVLITLTAVLLVVFAGCALLPGFLKTMHSDEPTPTVSISPSDNTPTVQPVNSGESISTDSASDHSTMDLLATGTFLKELDFGEVQASTYFFWSPESEYCMFIGSVQNAQKEYTPGVYLYNARSRHLTKLIEGEKGGNYFLLEPSWSMDGDHVTIPFHPLNPVNQKIRMYTISTDSIDELPFHAYNASFSTDSSRLVYENSDGKINLYRFSDKTITTLSDQIEGFSPVLFSDNKRILYCAPTGNNPSGMEYGWLNEIRMIDISKSINDQAIVIMPESSYRSIRWLIQDKLALIGSGMDDGHYTQLLNVETMQVTDFGEAIIEAFTGWNHKNKLVIDNIPTELSGKILNDQALRDLCILSVGKQINPISYLPDNTMLCLQNDADANKSYLSISDLNGNFSQKIGFIPGNLYPAFPSNDGKQVVLFDQYNNKSYLLDVEALYGQTINVTLAWNDRIYKVTNVDVPSNEIGLKIGSVTRQVSPKPEVNGDIARNTSEGPSILKSGYGNLYQISGCDQKDKIAVELSEGQYLICEYFSKLS